MSSSQQLHSRQPGRRALDVLAFVVDFKTGHCGDSPSLEEIAAGVGLASRSTVLVQLRALERHGLITRPAGQDARRIGIPGAVWPPPQMHLERKGGGKVGERWGAFEGL